MYVGFETKKGIYLFYVNKTSQPIKTVSSNEHYIYFAFPELFQEKKREITFLCSRDLDAQAVLVVKEACKNLNWDQIVHLV